MSGSDETKDLYRLIGNYERFSETVLYELRDINQRLEEGDKRFQSSDAVVFRPNRATDQHFAGALKEAVFKGVEVYAYDSTISLGGIKFNRRVPVDLDDNLRLT